MMEAVKIGVGDDLMDVTRVWGNEIEQVRERSPFVTLNCSLLYAKTWDLHPIRTYFPGVPWQSNTIRLETTRLNFTTKQTHRISSLSEWSSENGRSSRRIREDLKRDRWAPEMNGHIQWTTLREGYRSNKPRARWKPSTSSTKWYHQNICAVQTYGSVESVGT